MGEDETTVTHVKAISLSYFLDCTEEWQRTAGDQWEKQFLADVQSYAATFYPDLEVGTFKLSLKCYFLCILYQIILII